MNDRPSSAPGKPDRDALAGQATREAADPGIYAWTFACLGWPLAIVVPCCTGGPGPYLWGPVYGVAVLASAVLLMSAVVRGRKLTAYTRRALLHVALQGAFVGVGLACLQAIR